MRALSNDGLDEYVRKGIQPEFDKSVPTSEFIDSPECPMVVCSDPQVNGNYKAMTFLEVTQIPKSKTEGPHRTNQDIQNILSAFHGIKMPLAYLLHGCSNSVKLTVIPLM